MSSDSVNTLQGATRERTESLGTPDAESKKQKVDGQDAARDYEAEMRFVEQVSPYCYKIQTGFVPNMTVPGYFYVNDTLKDLVFEELKQFADAKGHGGFLPAVKQIANVASLPGIVKVNSLYILNIDGYIEIDCVAGYA
jgi:hypothetical protein